MDCERQLVSFQFRAVLSNSVMLWFNTSMQKIGLHRFRLYPHTFQLVLTLDESEKDPEKSSIDQEEKKVLSIDRHSADSLTATISREDSANSGDKTSSDLTNSGTTMASQFEEVLALRKQVQVGSLSVVEDEVILEARTRTFVKWINGHLHSRGIRVKNLDTDLENGVVLIKLLETLVHEKRIPGRLVS